VELEIPERGFFFDGAAHAYYLNRERLPSVTEVLEPLQELDGIPKATLAAARIRGQHVHHAVHLMIHKTLVWEQLDPKLVGYIQAAKSCIQENSIRVLVSEYRMHDPALKVAGTLDILGIMGRYTGIFDWKSAEIMPRTAGPQTAAYDQLYRRNLGGERRGFKRYGVQLFSDGHYKLFEYTDPRDWSWFVSALNLWHFRNSP
jgi:hypothetical protein